jgi:hypothetical protein
MLSWVFQKKKEKKKQHPNTRFRIGEVTHDNVIMRDFH